MSLVYLLCYGYVNVTSFKGLLKLYLLCFSFVERFAEVHEPVWSLHQKHKIILNCSCKDSKLKRQKEKKNGYSSSWVYFHVMQANFKRIGTYTGCFHLHVNWVRWQQVHLNLLKQSKHLPEAEPGRELWSQRICASAWAMLQHWLETKRPQPGTLLKLTGFDQNSQQKKS